MTKAVHRITNTDIENKTADCAKCGRVPVRLKGTTWVCLIVDRERKRHANDKRRYGAVQKRPDRCEVCGSAGKICFDHDHSTGKFRGWLCNNCNTALGYTFDNQAILRELANYIERSTNVIINSNEGNARSS